MSNGPNYIDPLQPNNYTFETNNWIPYVNTTTASAAGAATAHNPSLVSPPYHVQYNYPATQYTTYQAFPNYPIPPAQYSSVIRAPASTSPQPTWMTSNISAPSYNHRAMSPSPSPNPTHNSVNDSPFPKSTQQINILKPSPPQPTVASTTTEDKPTTPIDMAAALKKYDKGKGKNKIYPQSEIRFAQRGYGSPSGQTVDLESERKSDRQRLVEMMKLNMNSSESAPDPPSACLQGLQLDDNLVSVVKKDDNNVKSVDVSTPPPPLPNSSTPSTTESSLKKFQSTPYKPSVSESQKFPSKPYDSTTTTVSTSTVMSTTSSSYTNGKSAFINKPSVSTSTTKSTTKPAAPHRPWYQIQGTIRQTPLPPQGYQSPSARPPMNSGFRGPRPPFMGPGFNPGPGPRPFPPRNGPFPPYGGPPRPGHMPPPRAAFSHNMWNPRGKFMILE